MPSVLWIPGRIPGLNDLMRAAGTFDVRSGDGKRRSGDGKRWRKYNDVKAAWQKTIANCAMAQRFSVPDGSLHFNFLLIEPDRRRDPDNVLAAAQKLILDALVKAKLLGGDGWEHVEGVTAYPHVEPGSAGVFLVVQACPVLSRAALLMKLSVAINRQLMENTA